METFTKICGTAPDLVKKRQNYHTNYMKTKYVCMFRIVGSEICTTELQRTHCSASVALITLLSATYARQPCKRIALLRFHGNFIYTNSPRYYIVPSLCSLLQMRFDASKRHLQCALRTKHGSVETHLCVKGKVVLNSIQ
jgi:hypothetical protein